MISKNASKIPIQGIIARYLKARIEQPGSPAKLCYKYLLIMDEH